MRRGGGAVVGLLLAAGALLPRGGAEGMPEWPGPDHWGQFPASRLQVRGRCAVGNEQLPDWRPVCGGQLALLQSCLKGLRTSFCAWLAQWKEEWPVRASRGHRTLLCAGRSSVRGGGLCRLAQATGARSVPHWSLFRGLATSRQAGASSLFSGPVWPSTRSGQERLRQARGPPALTSSWGGSKAAPLSQVIHEHEVITTQPEDGRPRAVVVTLHGCLQKVTEWGLQSETCPTCHGTAGSAGGGVAVSVLVGPGLMYALAKQFSAGACRPGRASAH